MVLAVVALVTGTALVVVAALVVAVVVGFAVVGVVVVGVVVVGVVVVFSDSVMFDAGVVVVSILASVEFSSPTLQFPNP